MAEGNLAINDLSADGQTNLWDGLHSGLKVLNEGDDNTRMKAVLLLTDGQPNISPPRGHVPMLQQYKAGGT
jgi:Mg-chelatase subunit ChlD